jgi:hypothetical protein
VDVHIGPILRIRHAIPPLTVYFPCLLVPEGEG